MLHFVSAFCPSHINPQPLPTPLFTRLSALSALIHPFPHFVLPPLNLLSLSTHDDGMLQARVGTEADVYDTGTQLPKDKWMYMAMNYRRKTADDPTNRITMLYVTADDTAPRYIGKEVEAKDLTGNGRLGIGGDGMQGMVAGLSVWNSNITAAQLYETRTTARAAYTPGLVGYWNMGEGHGTQITDVARSRHIYMDGESWYINNENRAAHLSGDEDSPLMIDIATFNPSETDFQTDNFGESDYQQRIVIANRETMAQSVNAPALKPGSTKMRLDDSQFNFTASADEIYFSFPDSSLPLMDNNDFVATVSYIKDEHGNNSETAQWTFHTNFAAVDWVEEDGKAVMNYEKNWNETAYMYLGLKNNTETSQPYEITGLPTWLTADETVGSIDSETKYLLFTIAPSVAVGKHTEYLYVTDRLGIRRVMQVNLTVRGDEPEWTVDPNLYESNMTLTGQIYINDKICENTDTKIAAFDDMGLCRGVGRPAYVATRDAYYVDMVIYGASATELSSGERELSFKLYDASTGNIHPFVIVTLPEKTPDITLLYVPDANCGSYNSPVVLRATDIFQEPVSLPKGWSWMSIYVEPVITDIAEVLPQDATILKRFKNIKSKTAFASVNTNGQILGELTTIEPEQMYKMQLSTKTDFDVYGLRINVANTPQTIHPGYNWIESLSNRVMSPEEAFAELSPERGDRVKNRTTFAEYNGNGIWEGTLKSIVPGEGYIYRSVATESKTFHYPNGLANSSPEVRTLRLTRKGNAPDDQHFTPVDPYLYPDNMNIIAVVKTNGQERDDAEVAAFINGECRGAAGYNSGYYFLTIQGSSVDDAQQEMQLRVFIDGEELVVNDQLRFVSDAFYGSLDEPFVLDIQHQHDGITTVNGFPVDSDTDWYTLQGFKIGRRPTQPGVYIHRGEKVTVTRKK